MAPAIEWKPAYSVGDPQLDAQHKQIIALINDLFAAVESNGDRRVLKPILNQLVRYADVHFKDEEHKMLTHHYPMLEEHRVQHAQLRQRTVDLRDHLDQITPRDMLNFLKHWWIEHVQGADKQYAPYMDNLVAT